jgi:hypothetical protein
MSVISSGCSPSLRIAIDVSTGLSGQEATGSTTASAISTGRRTASARRVSRSDAQAVGRAKSITAIERPE